MKITVITVVYNSVKTIADALKSVAEQTYPDIEHIVIDGASTDGTIELIKRYQRTGDNTSRFVSEPDQGIYDAMNKGLNLATGDVIGFLNSDDVYAHNEVLAEVAEIHHRRDIDGCYADLIYLNDLEDTQIKRFWRSREYQPGLCFRGWMPAHPTLYLKARVFERVGQFNIMLGNQADLEFCARAFELHHINTYYSPQIWVKMRTGGASQSSISAMVKSNWRSYKALKKLGLKRNPVSFFAVKFSAKLPQFFTKQ